MKNLITKTFIAISILFGVITAVGIALFASAVVVFGINVFTTVFLIIEAVLASIFALFLCLFIKQCKKNKQAKLTAQVAAEREAQLLALYKSFGIPPQRKKDGTLKNFYELLGLTPQFDEFGARVPTIYELLNIVPKFDQNGNEIPSVVFIKNRAMKAATMFPQEIMHLVSAQSILAAAQGAAVAGQGAATKGKSAAKKGDSKPIKLKPMQKRKQKVANMTIKGSKAKNVTTVNIGFGSLSELFDIGTGLQPFERFDAKKPLPVVEVKPQEKKPEPKPQKSVVAEKAPEPAPAFSEVVDFTSKGSYTTRTVEIGDTEEQEENIDKPKETPFSVVEMNEKGKKPDFVGDAVVPKDEMIVIVPDDVDHNSEEIEKV